MDRRLSTLPYPPIPYCVTFFKRCLFVISIIYNCLCYDPCRPSYDPTNLLDGIYSMDYQVGPRSNLSKRPSPSTFPLEFLYLGRDTRYDSQLGVTLYLSEIFGSFEASKIADQRESGQVRSSLIIFNLFIYSCDSVPPRSVIHG